MLNLKFSLLFTALVSAVFCAPAQHLPGEASNEVGLRYYFQKNIVSRAQLTAQPDRHVHEVDIYYARNTAHRFFFRSVAGLRFSPYQDVLTFAENVYVAENASYAQVSSNTSCYLRLAAGFNLIQKRFLLRAGLEGRFMLNISRTDEMLFRERDVNGAVVNWARSTVKETGGGGAGAFLFVQASVPVLQKFRVGAEVAAGNMQFTGTIRRSGSQSSPWLSDEWVNYSSNQFGQWNMEILPRIQIGYTF